MKQVKSTAKRADEKLDDSLRLPATNTAIAKLKER